jgi:hypothetical protein
MVSEEYERRMPFLVAEELDRMSFLVAEKLQMEDALSGVTPLKPLRALSLCNSSET